MESKPCALTDILEQIEKQIYGANELVDAIDCKLNGPIPNSEGCERPDCLGVYEQAKRNLSMLNDLAAKLSTIAERL